MKILLTGSSGYLGQHFLHALIRATNDDDEIFATFGSNGAALEGIGILESYRYSLKIDKLDLRDKDCIRDYFEANGSFDICFHLAAMASPKLCESNPEKTKQTNIPRHLFNKLKGTPIIALSTDQVYCGAKAPYSENSEPGPVNVYAQSKLEMEQLLIGDKERLKPAVCLRSSIILGPLAPYGQAHSTFLHFCQSRDKRETTFFTDEIRSVISVKDVVAVLLHFYSCVKSAKEFKSTVFNMGGPSPVSRMDMAVAVAKGCGFSYDVFIAAEKAKRERGVDEVLSPLDISMNSAKLENFVEQKFRGLDAIVKDSFA